MQSGLERDVVSLWRLCGRRCFQIAGTALRGISAAPFWCAPRSFCNSGLECCTRSVTLACVRDRLGFRGPFVACGFGFWM